MSTDQQREMGILMNQDRLVGEAEILRKSEVVIYRRVDMLRKGMVRYSEYIVSTTRRKTRGSD